MYASSFMSEIICEIFFCVIRIFLCFFSINAILLIYLWCLYGCIKYYWNAFDILAYLFRLAFIIRYLVLWICCLFCRVEVWFMYCNMTAFFKLEFLIVKLLKKREVYGTCSYKDNGTVSLPIGKSFSLKYLIETQCN